MGGLHAHGVRQIHELPEMGRPGRNGFFRRDVAHVKRAATKRPFHPLKRQRHAPDRCVGAGGPCGVERGQVVGHAEGRAFPRARAQGHHAERRSIRHVRAAAHHAPHRAAPHAHHAARAGVGLGKCLALEVYLRAGRKPCEIEQQVRPLARCQRECPLMQRLFQEPTVSANHGHLDIAAPSQLIDARVRRVQQAYPVPRGVHLCRRLRLAVHQHAVAEKAVHHLHHAAAVEDQLVACVEPPIL